MYTHINVFGRRVWGCTPPWRAAASTMRPGSRPQNSNAKRSNAMSASTACESGPLRAVHLSGYEPCVFRLSGYEPCVFRRSGVRCPLSSEYATCETAKARFWPWLSGKSH